MTGKTSLPASAAIGVGLAAAAFLSNFIGMQSPTFTVGRAVPLLFYLGFTAALSVWTCRCLWRAVRRRTVEEWPAAAAALLALFILLVWPFTVCAGKMNHALLREEREAVIAQWQAGELRRTNSEQWSLPQNARDTAWGPNLYVHEDTVVFCTYSSFSRRAELLYSSETLPLWPEEKLVSLGEGWYWCVQNY